MTDYKTLHGKKIKHFSSDPPGSVSEGQIWYNSAATEYKSSVLVAAWSSGTGINTARQGHMTAGTTPAALVFGGNPGQKANSEEWDGSSWAEGDDLVNARGAGGGMGTQTAALAAGGSPFTDHTEEYNGSSWRRIQQGW
tara:strand:+ start:184 stop:600 length:417 start_codon:yes stop_codon:yes gene_type:complete